MIEQAEQVAQRLRMMIGWDTTKEAADVIDELVAQIGELPEIQRMLMAENKELRAEVGRLQSAFNDRVRVIEMQLKDKEQLRAEVERLQERMDEVIAADDKIIACQRDEIERLKQEQTLQAISDIGQLQEQANPTRSQKLAAAGYTRRAKGFDKEEDVEQAEPVLRPCACLFDKGVLVESCKYHAPAPQGQTELLRQALEALQTGDGWAAIKDIKQHLGEV